MRSASGDAVAFGTGVPGTAASGGGGWAMTAASGGGGCAMIGCPSPPAPLEGFTSSVVPSPVVRLASPSDMSSSPRPSSATAGSRGLTVISSVGTFLSESVATGGGGWAMIGCPSPPAPLEGFTSSVVPSFAVCLASPSDMSSLPRPPSAMAGSRGLTVVSSVGTFVSDRFDDGCRLGCRSREDGVRGDERRVMYRCAIAFLPCPRCCLTTDGTMGVAGCL